MEYILFHRLYYYIIKKNTWNWILILCDGFLAFEKKTFLYNHIIIVFQVFYRLKSNVILQENNEKYMLATIFLELKQIVIFNILFFLGKAYCVPNDKESYVQATTDIFRKLYNFNN